MALHRSHSPLAPENYNSGRHTHRIRTRQPGRSEPDWELLQTFLGLAFTIQQEEVNPKAPRTRPEDGQHPALQRIATFARNLTEASGAAIALGDANNMVCVARSGASAPPVGAEFNAADGLSGECIRNAEAVVCVNASADPRVNYQACRALNIASLLYLPLYSSQGKLMGILGVFSPQTLHFSQRDISCLRPTEKLVQEALGSTAENPDPATLAVLLRQAGFEGASKEEEEEVMDQKQEGTPAVAKTNWFLAPIAAVPVAPVVPVSPLQKTVAVPKNTPDPVPPRTEAKFVGRVVDESVEEFEPKAQEKTKLDEDAEGGSRLPVMVAVLLVALIAGAAYNYKRLAHGAHAPTKVTATKTVEPVATTPQTITASAPEPSQRKLTAAVTMSTTDNGAVVRIDLSKPIRYEGYQLDHPDRIYFDLHDARLSDDKGNEFDNPDGLVSGVRLFTYATGITRIVFDLRHPANFVATPQENPARLTIELKRTGDGSRISEAAPRTNLGLHTVPNSP